MSPENQNKRVFEMKLVFEVIYPPGDKQRNLPPVVMLHGMIDSRKTWKLIAPDIARNTGRLVYVVDARNHGESPRDKEMNWVLLADDIGDFLEQNNIPKAVLLGHSMGGRAAFTFALKRPDIVDKLIVEDIAVRSIRVKDGQIIINLIALLKESLGAIPKGADELKAKQTIMEFMKGFIQGSDSMDSSKFDTDFIPLKKDGSTFKWKANLEALERFLSNEELAHDVSRLGLYDGDALFLYGTKSFFRVNKDPTISKLFPHAIKIPFEGAHHLIHHQFPMEFTKVVSEFINKGNVSKL